MHIKNWKIIIKNYLSLPCCKSFTNGVEYSSFAGCRRIFDKTIIVLVPLSPIPCIIGMLFLSSKARGLFDFATFLEGNISCDLNVVGIVLTFDDFLPFFLTDFPVDLTSTNSRFKVTGNNGSIVASRCLIAVSNSDGICCLTNSWGGTTDDRRFPRMFSLLTGLLAIHIDESVLAGLLLL